MRDKECSMYAVATPLPVALVCSLGMSTRAELGGGPAVTARPKHTKPLFDTRRSLTHIGQQRNPWVYIYSSPFSDRPQRLSKKGSLAFRCWLPQFDSVEPIEWPQLPTSRSRVLLLSTNPELHAECLTAICFLKLLKRTALFPRLSQRLDPRRLSNAHEDSLMLSDYIPWLVSAK
jgi:hypothetical protein